MVVSKVPGSTVCAEIHLPVLGGPTEKCRVHSWDCGGFPQPSASKVGAVGTMFKMAPPETCFLLRVVRSCPCCSASIFMTCG